jgi:hypothetical protein
MVTMNLQPWETSLFIRILTGTMPDGSVRVGLRDRYHNDEKQGANERERRILRELRGVISKATTQFRATIASPTINCTLK